MMQELAGAVALGRALPAQAACQPVCPMSARGRALPGGRRGL